jgi:hypothetical protein
MPLTAEDKFEITELIHRLNYALDARDGDAYSGCFTEEAEFVLPDHTIVGHAGLREHAVQPGPYDHPVQHWSGNIVIDGDGYRARAKAYVLGPDGPRADGSYGLVVMGSVSYSAVRVDGTWLFDRLMVERDELWLPE